MSIVIILNSESMGEGDEELGKKLLGSFLRKCWQSKLKPDIIIFYNSAVKLLTKELGVLDALIPLSESGVDLIACGTCVGFFDLGDKIEIGRVVDMREIYKILMTSDKVISP